jgi:hypothetical protein
MSLQAYILAGYTCLYLQQGRCGVTEMFAFITAAMDVLFSGH